MEFESEEELRIKLQKLEDLYSKGKISESTYLDLKKKYTEALQALKKAPKIKELSKVEKKKKFPLKMVVIAIALVAAVGIAGFYFLGEMKHPIQTPTTTPIPSPSPTQSPSPTPSPTTQPTPPPPQGVPLHDVIASITAIAKGKCFQAYPIMVSTGPWPYDTFQPEAIDNWLIRFYCPWRDTTYQYSWKSGEISFEDPPGEVMFLPEFTPLELRWNISPAQAISIALDAGGRAFIESQSKPVRVTMHLSSRELAVHHRMIPEGDVSSVTSDYVWIVVFSTGGPGKKYKVYINAENGIVLKATEY